jgi:hypothetical protein
VTAIIDPRKFEHPFVSPGQLCFFFQVAKPELQRLLKSIGLKPARALAGHWFVPTNHDVYASSEVVAHLSGAALPIFLRWANGDIDVPDAPVGKLPAAPLSAITIAPSRPRGASV